MKYSFVLLPRAVCVVAKKTLGSLKAVPSPLASFLDPFPGELTRWRPTELLAELHKFHKSQTSPWNPSGRGRGKGPRRRTLRVRELKKKTKTTTKTGSVLLVAHKSGGACTVFPPPPSHRWYRTPSTRWKLFPNGRSHGGLSARRVSCSLTTAAVFRFAVHNCLNTVFLVNEVKKKKKIWKCYGWCQYFC